MHVIGLIGSDRALYKDTLRKVYLYITISLHQWLTTKLDINTASKIGSHHNLCSISCLKYFPALYYLCDGSAETNRSPPVTKSIGTTSYTIEFSAEFNGHLPVL